MTYQELLQIVELINASRHFTAFHVKCGEMEVDIRRAAPTAPAAPAAPAPLPTSAPRPIMPVSAAPYATDTPDTPEGYPDGAVLITAPMVGTFYRAPEPGVPPFVDIGQEVEPTSIVCIIEVMKLMNSIPAGCKGKVTHIGPQDGEPVQFGQLLLVIEPH